MGEIDYRVEQAYNQGVADTKESYEKSIITKARQPGWGNWCADLVIGAKQEGRREILRMLVERAVFMDWVWEDSKGIYQIVFSDISWDKLMKELED